MLWSRSHERPRHSSQTCRQPPTPLSARQLAETQIRWMLKLDMLLVGGRPPQKPNLGTVLDHDPSGSTRRNGPGASAHQ